MSTYVRVRIHLEGKGVFGATEHQARANVAHHLRGIADRLVSGNASSGMANVIADETEEELGAVTFSFVEEER